MYQNYTALNSPSEEPLLGKKGVDATDLRLTRASLASCFWIDQFSGQDKKGIICGTGFEALWGWSDGEVGTGTIGAVVLLDRQAGFDQEGEGEGKGWYAATKTRQESRDV